MESILDKIQIPDSHPAAGIIHYTLHLADNALIIAHRNSEWCGHGPILEQDIALANIALDLVGQARNFYQYVAALIAENNLSSITITEDDFAYLRAADEFKNFLLTEQSNGHWGTTILRQFLFSAYQYFLYRQLQHCSNEHLAAIAQKALKEVTYHVRWSSEWVIRLGDGTAESHQKMQDALNELWPFTDELLTGGLASAANILLDDELIKTEWTDKITSVIADATLHLPTSRQYVYGGTEGKHTPHLTAMLQDMQYLQRTYPGVEW